MGFLNSMLKSVKDLATESLTESGIYDPGRAKEYNYDDVGQIPDEMGTYRFLSKFGKEVLYIGISMSTG